MDLSDDEWTCLMIAAEGASMMAVGRWEASVDSLVTKGFMQRNDKFNNFITPAGREACRRAREENRRCHAPYWRRGSHTRVRARTVIEEAATKLAEAAQLGQRVQGGHIDGHVEMAAFEIIKRAKELVR